MSKTKKKIITNRTVSMWVSKARYNKPKNRKITCDLCLKKNPHYANGCLYCGAPFDKK